MTKKEPHVITPEYLAATNSESGHQCALFCYFQQPDIRAQYPETEWLFSVPNGGFRPKNIAAAMAAEGAKRGVPDICLPIRRGSFLMLWIELKRPKSEGKAKGVAKPEQKKWLAYFQSQGHGAAICVGWIEARDMIIEYLNWKG